MDLVERVRRYAEDHRLLTQGDSLVVGVSGGPDSLALLRMLDALRPAMSLDLHVVHVHHGLRGEEADADADYVMAQAAKWRLPATLRRADVPALVAARKLSVEEAARRARYTHLAEVALEVGARRIAVGHNADDQAETVLMHFVRGSGLAGLRGMRPLTPLGDYHLLRPLDGPLDLVRPMLAVPRTEIEAYCVAQGLQPRFDRSNLDRTYFRNRLRHEALPLLETLNPGMRDVLRRTAEVIAADYEVLTAQAEAAWNACLLDASETHIRFDRERWCTLPLSLQRATLRKAVWHVRQSLRDVTFVQIDDAVRVAATGGTGEQATLPAGLALRVGYDDLTISQAGNTPKLPNQPLLAPGERHEIPVPGGASLSSGWRLSLAPFEGEQSGPAWKALLADRWATPLDADVLGEGITLRSRLPGDRFQPQGVGGTQKVADFMVNVKIPASWRDRVPLLVSTEAIAWVAGWRVDERFAVTHETRRVVIARFDHIQEPN
jgi:tRNA(Ile)-lysidine synthetase-like protein